MKNKTGESLVMKKDGYMITYLKPCVTDKNKKMAEIMLGHKIDISAASKKLMDIYRDINYSQELGVAKIKEGKMTIMIFAEGKLVFREAADEAAIISGAQKIAKALN